MNSRRSHIVLPLRGGAERSEAEGVKRQLIGEAKPYPLIAATSFFGESIP
jgi:hypothetical protein